MIIEMACEDAAIGKSHVGLRKNVSNASEKVEKFRAEWKVSERIKNIKAQR